MTVNFIEGSSAGKVEVDYEVHGDLRNGRWRVSEPGERFPEYCKTNEDGTVSFSVAGWPSIQQAAPYGSFQPVLITRDVSELIGRVIVNTAVFEHDLKDHLEALVDLNGSDQNWQGRKMGQVITRFERELDTIAARAPVAVEMLLPVLRRYREYHFRRGLIAHGDLRLEMTGDEFGLVVTSSRRTVWLKQSELLDLAMKVLVALLALNKAFDPKNATIARQPAEVVVLENIAQRAARLLEARPREQLRRADPLA